MRTSSPVAFACLSKACAPPPVGTGGSRPGAGSASSPTRAVRLGVRTMNREIRRLEKAQRRLGNGESLSDDDQRALDALDAVDHYTKQGFETVNTGLRRGDDLSGSVGRTVKDMDEAFDRFGVTLTERSVLHRGMSGPPLEESGFVVGAEITDKGFMSASSEEGMAKFFGGLQRGRGRRTEYRMRVSVPGGTRVLVGNPLEDELILPRGSRFVVRGVSENRDKGGRSFFTVDVDLL
jgi:hypothetical protein